jgi:hypothetical protein
MFTDRGESVEDGHVRELGDDDREGKIVGDSYFSRMLGVFVGVPDGGIDCGKVGDIDITNGASVGKDVGLAEGSTDDIVGLNDASAVGTIDGVRVGSDEGVVPKDCFEGTDALVIHPPALTSSSSQSSQLPFSTNQS